MRLVAECPEEEREVSKLSEELQLKTVFPVYEVSYAEGFYETMLSSLCEKNVPEEISQWSSEERLCFLSACKEELADVSFCKLEESFCLLIQNFEMIFQERKRAFYEASSDFKKVMEVLTCISSLEISNFSDLKEFLKNNLVKKDEIRTVFLRYDEENSTYMLNLNSIKVSLVYTGKQFRPGPVVLAWNDSEFSFSYEFFTIDLMKEIQGRKKEAAKSLNEKLCCMVSFEKQKINIANCKKEQVKDR